MEHIRFLVALACMFVVGIGFIYGSWRHAARQKEFFNRMEAADEALISAIKARKQAIKESK